MNQTIKLDTRKCDGAYGKARIATLRRGERNNALLTVKVCANGQPYDLAGKTASLVATTAAGKLVGPCPMEVAEAGIARIMLPAALYSAVGSFSGYVEIREGDTLVDTTDRFGGKVIECADLDSEQAAEFTPLLGELQNAVAEEAKRVEAENARTQAETERETGFAEAKQAAQTATTAANDAAAGARSAAGSASDAAESANTAAGKANDAATKAVTDAKAAIADVKATEAKLYPVAENVLKGKVKDTFVHVDDAFPSSLLGIEVEGACRQDGTPSQDNPVPIEVVENPVLKVQGRNFAEATNISTSKDIYSGVLFVEADIKPSENYILSFDVDTGGNRYYLNESLFTFIDFEVKKGKNYVQCRTVDSISKSNPAQYNTNQKLKGWNFFKNSIAQGKDVQFSNVQLERGSTASDYAPYVGTSQAFTLPAEHPYLAKLPDGTADTIDVDREGNVELVARIGKDDNVRNVNYFSVGKYYELSTKLPAFANVNSLKSSSALCSAIQSSIHNTDGIYRTWTGVYVIDTSGHTKEEIQAEVDKNAPLTVFAPIPETRYQLGKIEMPKAQDSVINVWTDAEVMPRTGIEYVRDVNIVVENLESAIASIS